MSYLITNGLIVTGDKTGQVLRGEILVESDRISAIAPKIHTNKKFTRIDAGNCFVIPGFVQAHIHLCQTLFRGMADDLALLDWLEKKIWPLEKAHTPKSLTAASLLGIVELTRLGTTTILDMGTVKHTHDLLEAVTQSGIRYWGGKCLMDDPETAGPLFENTKTAIKESEDLIQSWHHKQDIVNYALCPRFAVSCTTEILEFCAAKSVGQNLILHTHASENRGEIELVRKKTGLENIAYLKAKKLLSPRSVIAHSIHINNEEMDLLAHNSCSIVHCPSSNLKLASGVARIQRYLKRGINVALGADGAACSNTLDPFLEMRLAALLQKPIFGPRALNARRAFLLATMGGAIAVQAQDQIGSLEVGKKADIVLVDRSHPSVATVEDPYSALVYSCSGRDVRDVFINGRWVVKNKTHQVLDEETIIHNARRELKQLLRRV